MFGYGSTGGRRSKRSGSSSGRGTMYLHAPEYHGPSRKGSMDSAGSEGADESQTLVDLNKISHDEFQRLYHRMRKGEPNNRVNF